MDSCRDVRLDVYRSTITYLAVLKPVAPFIRIAMGDTTLMVSCSKQMPPPQNALEKESALHFLKPRSIRCSIPRVCRLSITPQSKYVRVFRTPSDLPGGMVPCNYADANGRVRWPRSGSVILQLALT